MERKIRKNTSIMRGMRRKAAAVLGMVSAAALLCTGCGASSDRAFSEMAVMDNKAADSYESYDTGGSAYEEEGALAPTVSEEGADLDIREGRKLIETVRLELETREFQQMMSGLETQIQELGGYVESMETYNGSSYSGSHSRRSASLTVRIPSDKLEGFLQTVAESGNIVRRSDTVEDVTLTYVDMESRRDVLRTEQSRLMEFLEKAETIEEIIAIEERLSEVRYQLESMESRLRAMDNLIDYSTVYIDVSEVTELTPVEEPTVWERISDGFAGSLESIGQGVLEFGIWFLVHLPYLFLWGILITVTVLLIRRRSRNRRRKLEEQLRKTVPPVSVGFEAGENKEK